LLIAGLGGVLPKAPPLLMNHCRNRAAAPATFGLANEVPLPVR